MDMTHAASERDASALSASAPHLVIVGAGITGLSAAWYARHAAARAGLPLRVSVLEASGRCGGKLRTDEVTGFGAVPFRLEASADGFLTRKPWALALARELGLEDEVLYSARETAQTRVWHDRRLIPLPQGLSLLPPTRLGPFLRSPLFSPAGKARALLELALPARPPHDDESLASFVRRRFGAEMLDRVAVPLLAGVYNARPERMSLRATFPQFAAMERADGSVTRGARRAAKSAPAASGAAPFFSFVGGAQTLVDALVDRLAGDVRTASAATAVEPAPAGGFHVRLGEASTLVADAVILATPANVAADLLRQTAPEAAALLSGIRYEGIGALYLGYRQRDVPRDLTGYGVLIPPGERNHLDGITWTSSKWRERAPEGHVLLRVFFGGPFTRDSLALEDERLVPLVTRELAGMLGIVAPPVLRRAYRWLDGYPQYDVGHLDRLDALTRALPRGLAVAGSAYRGVGVPDCVRQGEQAANDVLEQVLSRPRRAG
ncbi:MAG TPA: protoporphyrinogen oxidase [Ktedonobacterales bacterium]|nr:protoporphyrinogen oxidase [Ktedonobacterales bacterium]